MFKIELPKMHVFHRSHICMFQAVYIFKIIFFIVCFVALRSKSTAMVIAGRSGHLSTLFPGQA